MSDPTNFDIKGIIEDFVRTATPEQMLIELQQSDPNGVLGTYSVSILDAQPKRFVFSLGPENSEFDIDTIHLANWGIYRTPIQRRWDNRLVDLPLAA